MENMVNVTPLRTPALILFVKGQILRTWGGGGLGKKLQKYGWPHSSFSDQRTILISIQ